MDDKWSGILMVILGIILAVLWFALPTFLIYTYWLAVIVLIGYGAYLYMRT
jgi:hypothetical protein